MKCKNKNNKILYQMFDVRPVKRDGNLDFGKIHSISSIVKIKSKPDKKLVVNVQPGEVMRDVKAPDPMFLEVIRFQKLIQKEAEEKALARKMARRDVLIEYDKQYSFSITPRVELDHVSKVLAQEEYTQEEKHQEYDWHEQKSYLVKENFSPPLVSKKCFPWKEFFLSNYLTKTLGLKRSSASFVAASLSIFFLVFGLAFFFRGLRVKESALDNGRQAYANIAYAQEEMLKRDFKSSSYQFQQAGVRFSEISRDINDLGGVLVKITRFFPYVSKISSGVYLAEVGKDISQIGMLAGELADTLGKVENPLNTAEEGSSMLRLFQDTQKNLKEADTLLQRVEKNLSKVNIEDIPQEHQSQFVRIKGKLPEITAFTKEFLDSNQILADVLGGNGPRKYLFLFQNNQEMRATGGFIGTYGVLDIFNGRVRSFFVDGIFNPDGQLKIKVVPPGPIQKISVAWSLHDSNWFPDFPVSAEKAMWFYEKTGGPTVDGVITMTPEIMRDLLEITGPIEMPEYDVVVDTDNFIEKIQYEVEVDYDKEANEPKKILADLAPKILDRIFNARSFADMARTADVLIKNLREKHMLVYARNYEVEKKLSELGWSGEMLRTGKDYVSVINTNINGYKTDGVVDETIEHEAKIQSDGSIIDSVTITRHHNGGDKEYEWWNKVNADYMRVYVPKGSRLISVEGQTVEFDTPPLDYQTLAFKRDPEVETEEGAMTVNEESGTRIYEDADKTVFANWVYVSPQETTIVKYTYILPFRIYVKQEEKITDAYSLLAQKQSGSMGSKFISIISYPNILNAQWQYPDEIKKESQEDRTALTLKTDLKTDKFIGTIFTAAP